MTTASARNRREIGVQSAFLPFTDFASITPRTRIKTLNLNWTERDLPEHLRTKHVHRLHPYLGKFIPQLVEIFLRKYQPKVVCDPFCGSGTTLVQALELGIDAIGCDISAFNCLLSRVKTARYDLDLLEREIKDIATRVTGEGQQAKLLERKAAYASDYLAQWFAPEALQTLLLYRSLIRDYLYQDVMNVILSRSALSARLTTHFDLDFHKHPQTQKYYCYKHSRTCEPTRDAAQFIKRYSYDTIKRIREFAALRTDAEAKIIHGDARTVEFPPCDLIITSPPYVGLIDYHEQHRYAYELLGLEWNARNEIGAATNGNSGLAKKAYVEGMIAAFENVKRSLTSKGRLVVIVNDKHNLYPEIAKQLGFKTEAEIHRHVNRRTGRRADDFFESVLVWKPA
ncbi:MAG: DNA methyltransferase [Nitrososphaerota archaeon]